MLRRSFLVLAAAAPPAWAKIKTRGARIEKVFDSPGPRPNGLQATDEGLWILDQGNNHAYLVSYEDGRVLRDLHTDSDRGSGITFDGEAIWIGSTYNRKTIRSDAKTGQTLAEFYTPGAGVIYQMPNDAPGRRSPLLPPPVAARPGLAAVRSPTITSP